MKSCIMPAMLNFRTGTPVIVGDTEIEEEYVADFIKHDGTMAVNPFVEIRFVLRYPMQHAIIWPEVPCENLPIAEGVICCLPMIRAATLEEVNRFGSYAESLKAAQEQRLFQARREHDSSTVEIILRHMRGEYRRSRYVMALKRWEI